MNVIRHQHEGKWLIQSTLFDDGRKVSIEGDGGGMSWRLVPAGDGNGRIELMYSGETHVVAETSDAARLETAWTRLTSESDGGAAHSADSSSAPDQPTPPARMRRNALRAVWVVGTLLCLMLIAHFLGGGGANQNAGAESGSGVITPME